MSSLLISKQLLEKAERREDSKLSEIGANITQCKATAVIFPLGLFKLFNPILRAILLVCIKKMSKKFKLGLGNEAFFLCEVDAEAFPHVNDSEVLKAIGDTILEQGVVPHSKIPSHVKYECVKIQVINGDQLLVECPEMPALQLPEGIAPSPPRKKLLLSPSAKMSTNPGSDCKEVTTGEVSLCNSLKKLTPFKQSPNDNQGEKGHVRNIDFDFDADFAQIDWGEDKDEGVKTFEEAAIVKISDIAEPFSEILFTKFINESLIEEGFIKNGEPKTKVCSEFNTADKSVLMEFPCAKSAEDLCASSKKFRYILQDLRFELKHKDSGVSQSTSVLISNIPKPFVEELFMKYIMFHFKEKNILKNGQSTPKCSKFNEVDSSVVIDFETREEALKVTITITNLKFLRNELRFSMVEEEVVNCHLKISNIPIPFDKELLISYLDFEITCSIIGNAVDFTSLKFSDFIPTDQSVLVEFQDKTLADTVCKQLEGLSFGDNTLDFQIISNHFSNNKNKDTSIEDTAKGACSTAYTKNGANGEISGHQSKVSYRTDWPGFETCQFLKICIEHKNQLQRRNSGDGWSNVSRGMSQLGLHYTVETLKKRLKGLVAWAPKAAPGWDYQSLVDEYRGNAPSGSGIIPAKFHCKIPSVSYDNAKKPYHCGAVVMAGTKEDATTKTFKYEHDLLLISEYKRLKPRFDDSITRSSALYAEISSAFRTAHYGPQFSPEVCCNRMAYLAGEFKRRYDQLKNKTGSSSEPRGWVYWDEMSLLFEGSVVLEPQKVVSWGSHYQQTIRGEIAPKADKVVRSKNPKASNSDKKSSPTNPSIKQRKVQAAEDMVKELKRFNDIAEKSGSSSLKD